MSPDKHAVCGLVLGTTAFALTKKIEPSVAAAFSTVICDFDHVLEYGMYCIRQKVKPNLKCFFSGKYFQEKGTLYIVFHGYEYLLLLILIAIVLFRNQSGFAAILVSAIIGYFFHLLMDVIGNDCGIPAYSLLVRWNRHWKLP